MVCPSGLADARRYVWMFFLFHPSPRRLFWPAWPIMHLRQANKSTQHFDYFILGVLQQRTLMENRSRISFSFRWAAFSNQRADCPCYLPDPGTPTRSWPFVTSHTFLRRKVSRIPFLSLIYSQNIVELRAWPECNVMLISNIIKLQKREDINKTWWQDYQPRLYI